MIFRQLFALGRKISAAVVVAVSVGACTSGADAGSGRDANLAEKEDVGPKSGLRPCSERLPLVRDVRLTPAMSVADGVKSAFGIVRKHAVEENVELMPAVDGRSAFLRVHYPQGSVSFSTARRGRPLGGASFYAPFANDDALCLHYKVRFQEGFEFVKGGKLPGLYAGRAPSGGEAVTGRNGWSVRLMWREDGQGELYEYIVNKMSDSGLSVGRGNFTFPRGRWVSVDLEIVANSPGRQDGVARLWIDDRAVIEQDDIVFTTQDRVVESGLMFSTFFGGNDDSWATPKDQYVDFADFRMYAGGPG